MKTLVVLCLCLFSLSLSAIELDAKIIDEKQDLPGLTIAEQKVLLKELRTRAGPYGKTLNAYYVPKDDPALDVLAPEMLDRLYKLNVRGSQSNCYWTSMFSSGAVGLPERYMDMPEYERLLATHFELRQNPREFFPGDVLRLKRARGGMDTHSVVYLGTLKDNPYTHLVLSKNGPVNGPYVIMELSMLENRVYVGSRVAGVYRPR